MLKNILFNFFLYNLLVFVKCAVFKFIYCNSGHFLHNITCFNYISVYFQQPPLFSRLRLPASQLTSLKVTSRLHELRRLRQISKPQIVVYRTTIGHCCVALALCTCNERRERRWLINTRVRPGHQWLKEVTVRCAKTNRQREYVEVMFRRGQSMLTVCCWRMPQAHIYQAVKR